MRTNYAERNKPGRERQILNDFTFHRTETSPIHRHRKRAVTRAGWGGGADPFNGEFQLASV